MKSSDIFNCKKCGDCCKGYGGTFVTPEDITAIARFIETDPDTFVNEYCTVSGGKPLLNQGQNSYCIFWDKICTIHPVRPRICKMWPFIESVLIDVMNWYIMAGFCPGIRIDVADNIILECVRKELFSHT